MCGKWLIVLGGLWLLEPTEPVSPNLPVATAEDDQKTRSADLKALEHAEFPTDLPDLEEADVRQALAYAAALAQDEVHTFARERCASCSMPASHLSLAHS